MDKKYFKDDVLNEFYERVKDSKLKNIDLYYEIFKEIDQDIIIEDYYASLRENEKENIIRNLYILLKKFIPLNFVLGPIKYVNKKMAFRFLVSILNKTCKFHIRNNLISDLIKYANILNLNPLILLLLHTLSEYCSYENS